MVLVATGLGRATCGLDTSTVCFSVGGVPTVVKICGKSSIVGTNFLVQAFLVVGAGVCGRSTFFYATLDLLTKVSFLGHALLVVACPSPQLAHLRVTWLSPLHWLDGWLPAEYLHVWVSLQLVLAMWPNLWQLKHC